MKPFPVKDFNMFANILHPNRYHGQSARPPFFEGWYFKLVSEDEQTRYAIIPGVYLAEDAQKSHSFVQVFDSNADEVRYHQYAFEAFRPSPNSFEIRVGPNYFSANKITLAIDDPLGSLEGTLVFENLTPWPVRFTAPGAMGWFAWMPFMETYHGVVSMDHQIEGHLALDGVPVNFSGGRGYLEKDWGKQFPSAWIWGQSNHFSKPGISVMISVAVIPWLRWSFAGFIIGLNFDGKIHRFATYNRSRIENIAINDHEAALTVRNATHRLRISATRVEGSLLRAPTMIEMDRRILETLDARITISFEDLKGQILFTGTGKHAGLETVGDLDKLIGLIS